MKRSLILLFAAASLLHAEAGALTIHMILHAIGEEHYEIAPDAAGGLKLNTTFEYTDRGSKRTTSCRTADESRLYAD